MRTFERLLRKAPFREVTCYRCGERLAPDSNAVQSLLFGNFDEDPSRDAPEDPAAFDPLTLEESDPSMTAIGRTANNTAWHHVDCALDVDLDGITTVLQRCKDRDGELERLYRVALDRRRVRNAIARARAGDGAVSDLVVGRIAPAHDRQGRPRVSVVAIGSGASSTSWVGMAMDALMRDASFASPKREYVFHTFSSGFAHEVATDPSQPIVATLFISIASVKIVKAQRDKLAALRAINAPSPRLWIVGPETRDRKTLDAKVLELRAELDRAGFSGDEALVLASEKVDEDALRSLVAMLDDERPASATTTTANAFATRIALIEQALEHNDAEQITAQIEQLTQTIASNTGAAPREYDDPTRARLVALGYRALAHTAARRGALALLYRFDSKADTAAIHACARQMFTEPGRSLSKDFDLAAAVLTTSNDATRFALYADGVTAPECPKLRRDAIARYLERCADRTVAARLTAASEALKSKDPRRLEFEAIAARIHSNAEAAEKKAALAETTRAKEPPP
ncbi:MAG: hypothetical protein U0269_13410 [Polyangiales bacterium]